MRQLAFLCSDPSPRRRRLAPLRGRQGPELRRRHPAHRQATLRQLPRQRQAEGRPQPRHLRRDAEGRARPGPSSCPATRTSRGSSLLTDHREEPKMPSQSQKIPAAQIATIKLWIEQGAKENAGSKVSIPPTPKTDIGLKSVVKGRPEGPPPMPAVGKLKLDPVVVARRPGAVLALATSPWAPLAAVGGQKQVILYNTDSGALIGVLPFEHGQINSHQVLAQREVRARRRREGRAVRQGGAVQRRDRREGAGGRQERDRRDPRRRHLRRPDADRRRQARRSSCAIYSTTDGSVLREIKKHTDWVTAVEYSPDGVLLATGDRNGGAVRVGSVHRPRVLQPSRAHRDDHRRVVARRLQRAGLVAARTPRSSSGRWRTAATSRTGRRTPGGAASVQVHARRQARLHRPRQSHEALGPERRGTEVVRGRSPIWACASRSRTTTRR